MDRFRRERLNRPALQAIPLQKFPQKHQEVLIGQQQRPNSRSYQTAPNIFPLLKGIPDGKERGEQKQLNQRSARAKSDNCDCEYGSPNCRRFSPVLNRLR